MQLSDDRLRLLNDFQRDFPLEPRPYARIAGELGIAEDDVLAILGELSGAGAISRVGAVVRPNTVGASTLAAMRVPPERLEAVAAQVSARPEVNHNYERDHAINLWFVVTAESRDAVLRVLGEIEAATAIQVLDLPLVTPFHIDLGFDLRC
jgi:DNA-binding Lrp family transcriptional regulator